VAHTACLVDHAGSRDGGNDICTRGEGGEEKKNGECKNSEHLKKFKLKKKRCAGGVKNLALG